jgi:hypothetical protein
VLRRMVRDSGLTACAAGAALKLPPAYALVDRYPVGQPQIEITLCTPYTRYGVRLYSGCPE